MTNADYSDFMLQVNHIYESDGSESPITHFVVSPDTLRMMTYPGSRLTPEAAQAIGFRRISMRDFFDMGVVYELISRDVHSQHKEPLYLPRGLAAPFLMCALWPSTAMDAAAMLETMGSTMLEK